MTIPLAYAVAVLVGLVALALLVWLLRDIHIDVFVDDEPPPVVHLEATAHPRVVSFRQPAVKKGEWARHQQPKDAA